MAISQEHGSAFTNVREHGPDTADSEMAELAAAWLRGEGDLTTAGMGRSVPVAMQLGVLAHADIGRLQVLGRYCRRGSVRRAWGTEMARLAGAIATAAGDPATLRQLQADVLVPLELEVLDGRRKWTRRELVDYLQDNVASGRN